MLYNINSRGYVTPIMNKKIRRRHSLNIRASHMGMWNFEVRFFEFLNTPQTLVALAFEPRGGGAKPPDGKERGVLC